MSNRTTDDLIVMLARRARRARRKAREVEAYHRRLAEERTTERDEALWRVSLLDKSRQESAAETSRLAQELSAARLATQDADERAQMERDRDEMRRKHDALADQRVDAFRAYEALKRELEDVRHALAEALTRVEAREEEIRRLSNRVEAAERAERVCTDEMRAAFGDVGRLAALSLSAEAEIKRLRREVEIRDAGVEMGVALVRFWEGVARGRAWSLFERMEDALSRVCEMHDADEAARAAHPLARGGS
jgi:chromosome segregation ATPase